MTVNFLENGVDCDITYLRKDAFIAGGLWTWGNNSSGQLGDNTSSPPGDTSSYKSSPVQTIAGSTNWKQVAAGNTHIAAIKTDGTLWTWGGNSDGQLGNNTTTDKISPIQTIITGNIWKQVSCGNHTIAIKTDGTLWGCGNNIFGQLGDATIASKSSLVQVIGANTDWKQVAAGYLHTATVKTDGTLWVWGYNASGQLGINNLASQSLPVQIYGGGTNWKQVACGYKHTAAVKTDGTLWTWGYNISGQLGDSTTAGKNSIVQTAATGTNWKQVSCGYRHTAAVKTDGTLWTWGTNALGELGDNTSTNKSSPIQTITGGTNWKQVACGQHHTAAVKTDGTLWAWGYNASGQLGDNTIINKSSPVQIYGGGTNWRQTSAGALFSTAITEISP